ncbi:kelch repeat and BTB domain-containing protein 12-like [Amblyomma americanum]
MDPLFDDGKSREQQAMQLSLFCEALWLKHQLTDVEVQVETEVFPAHKLVLTCHSPYFHKLLINTKPEMLKVQLNGITHESFSVLLEYMYTGRLQLTCQNIVDVFQASKHLDMKRIKERCAQVLTSSPDDPLHALFVYVSAKKLGTKPAWQRAYKTILGKFHLVAACPEFLALSAEQVCEILAADSIAARSETELFEVALKWLGAKWPMREQHVVELLRCIRFSGMPMEEAVACFHPPLLPEVTAKPEVREMLNNAVCYISAKQVGQESKFKQYTHPQRRFLLKEKPEQAPEMGMGDATTVASSSRASSMSPPRASVRRRAGKQRANSPSAYTANEEEDASSVSPPAGDGAPPRAMEIPTADGEEAAEQWLGDPLLHEMLHSRALNERTRVVEWDEYAAKVLPEDSRIRRGSPGVLLVGGIDPHLPHQVLTGCAVLAYEETDDRWHRVAMLPEPRHHHAGAIVGDNVYVIGGLNSRRTLRGRLRPLASCLCYQLGQRQWAQLPDLQLPRAYHGCAAIDGTLFAVGGRDKRGRLLDSVEWWAPGSDRWREISEPLRPGRMAAAVAASDRMLCVAGGVARTDGRLWLLRDVDCYDVRARRWFRGPRLPWPVCLGSLVSTGSGMLVHLGGLSQCPSASAGGAVAEAAAAADTGTLQHDGAAMPEARAFRSRSDVVFWDSASADGRWKSSCPLPAPRHGLAAAVCAEEETLYVLGGLSTSMEWAPLEVLTASTADSTDRSFYRACQLPGPLTGSLALPLPDVASIPVSRRRSSSS